MFHVFRRELEGYFVTPVAYVFIVAFLLLSGIFTFYLGGFLERGQADLFSFFVFHPWLYLLFMPALAMRLWSEEQRSGTIELLMTMPLRLSSIVIGKFLAAWCFAGLALALTFPVWITVSYLGSPDHGLIVASYLSSLFMAGCYLALASCLSATTKNQVVAFVLGVLVCFLFTVAGLPIVLEVLSAWAPVWLIDAVASFSFISRFENSMKGLLDARDYVYFLSMIVFWLAANVMVVEAKRMS